MRRLAWILVVGFAFTVQWEYSLDLGEPLGNVSRIAGLLVLLAAAPAILQRGRMRAPGAFCWVTLGFFLWFCASLFWTVDTAVTLERLRGYFQEFMIVWLVWEFADRPEDLRVLMRAFVAGSWVLAVLTLAAFHSPEAVAADQIRFAAYGQDPNEVARFIDLGFPLAALLVNCERRWGPRLMALGFLPVGVLAVLLTASRSGFLAAVAGLAGSLAILTVGHRRRMVAVVYALPLFLIGLWAIIPSGTLGRLATIPEQLQGGDWNQRTNIWSAGWEAFLRAPLAGTGAGSFVAAARLAPIDTAHNTMLSIAIGGGLVALMIASVLMALAVRAALRTRGQLRVALATCLAVWTITTFIATVEENRTTWLLFGMVIVAARLEEEDAGRLGECFGSAALGRLPPTASARLAEG